MKKKVSCNVDGKLNNLSCTNGHKQLNLYSFSAAKETENNRCDTQPGELTTQYPKHSREEI
jgi:hypothetical protein